MHAPRTYNEWMYPTPVTHITEEEYDKWLETSNLIGNNEPIFTSCCGPHEFAQDIIKDGIYYSLHSGWYPEEDTTLNAKYKYKTTYWWGIKTLGKAAGQDGEGI